MIACLPENVNRKKPELGILFVTVASAMERTMSSHHLFTQSWWFLLALNVIALPLGWLAIHYLAPAIGNRHYTD